MLKQFSIGVLWALVAIFFVTACKPSQGPTKVTGYFQTHYQDESQFVVETIVADVAEQVYFAKFHQLPGTNDLFVSATEMAGSPFGAPVYQLAITLNAKHHDLLVKLEVNGPIWSPQIYDNLATQLAKMVGLAVGVNEESTNTALLAKLTDGLATTIEVENQKLSSALDNDFTNPNLHAQAAVLLGAFTLREHSGSFFEIRTPLCRLTAHLVMARLLGGESSLGINGRIAEGMLLTLMNNQSAALEKLSAIDVADPVLKSWVRALQTRNTADYRPLDKLDGLSQIECREWFCALNKSANTDLAWNKLSEVQKKVPDFVRVANEGDYSVGVGHELLAVSIPLELAEVATIYKLSQKKQINKDDLTQALNQLPERCFTVDLDNKAGPHIIGWGLWAGFFQRQLCHAIQHDFDFMQRKWGVPDDAKTFSTKCDQLFNGLRLYPFVRRFDSTEIESYQKSVDDGFKVTVATPQLVSAECWNNLCWDLSPGVSYQPNPNPHINEWHAHNPPPGTAYDLSARLNHPSLVGRPDSEALLQKLHILAPYHSDLIYFILNKKYGMTPPYEQATNLFGPLLDYADYAMQKVASTVQNQPDRYEQLLSKAAALNPSFYFTLGVYFRTLKQDQKAVAYFEKGNALDPDSVRAAAYAGWLIKYYLKHGQVETARRLADNAGEVYSSAGLAAKAEFLEATGDPAGAFEWFSKMEERYDESGPVIAFCLRYKAKTNDPRFDGELKKRLGKLFPKGLETMTLNDFQAPPTDGVVFKEASDLLTSAGLKIGDVIVAVYGVRVHGTAQYNYGREFNSTPELDLIVWEPGDRHYHEIKASPPDHRFGVDIGDYQLK